MNMPDRLTTAAAHLGTAGLYVLAAAAVWKTAPGHIGIAMALLAAIATLVATRPPALDSVTMVSAAVAAWMTLRVLLQAAGFGDPDLFDSRAVFVDWLFPLLFLPLAMLPVADRTRRLFVLWLLAMAGFTAGIAEFLHQRGLPVLWSGERLGFHLAKPLGIGLYAGCFLIMIAGTWQLWWHSKRWQWPKRLLGLGALVLLLEVLITAQNRSTYLGLALVATFAATWRFWAAFRSTAPEKWRQVAILAAIASIAGVTLIGLNRNIVEMRLAAEHEIVQTIDTEGLEHAPASSISIRLHLWQYVLQRFPAAPWIGHGYGNLEHIIERDVRANAPLAPDEAYDHVHNSYLQTLWTHGIIGTGLWVALLVALLHNVIHAARDNPRVRALLPTVWAVLGFTAVWAFFDYRLSHPDMRFFTTLLLLSLRLLGQSGTPSHSGAAQ